MIITFYNAEGTNVAEIVAGDAFDPDYIIKGYLDNTDETITEIEVEFDV